MPRSPLFPVEKPRKKRKLYLPPSPRVKVPLPRSGGGFSGRPLGPLPTGQFKPSKVLVTNPRDWASEVSKEISFSEEEVLSPAG